MTHCSFYLRVQQKETLLLQYLHLAGCCTLAGCCSDVLHLIYVNDNARAVRVPCCWTTASWMLGCAVRRIYAAEGFTGPEASMLSYELSSVNLQTISSLLKLLQMSADPD